MNFKKVLLTSVATTAAAGALFATSLQVAEAAPAYTAPVDKDGNIILGGNADVNPVDTNADKPADTPADKPADKPAATPDASNQFKKSVDADGVPTSVSGKPAVEQKEEVKAEDPNYSPYEYEAETKEKAIEIGQAMLDRSKLEGTALAQVNNHVDAVQTASGKWTPTFSFVEKAAKEDKKAEAKKEDKKADPKKDVKVEDKKAADKKAAGAKADAKKAADKKVAAKKADAVKANGKKEAAKKAKSTLPKTGAVASAAPAVLGLALASVGTAFAFGKKKEDK
ncbi:LPXTG cell wall anchor domain-containing protein [Aerococcus sp. UMB7834]|uniref:LPXTG cell wall anchor domain-containing protein n=1 Tax=Aerococcus sp. UMB7834 TaxID=3046342 RepID=UPI00254F5EA8|nr:LPXTG cell wall anchor domain-containing protein [Aerococcus sp. UMB7834]MDK6804441.1 LPXTG cell wall anchor domain-containing protein [Aerococcus sp. UMB7834]